MTMFFFSHKVVRNFKCYFKLHLVNYQAERDKQLRERQMAQEEALAIELERQKLETLRDDKMRQQIREQR